MIRRMTPVLGVCALVLSAIGCGRPFRIPTAPGLVELHEAGNLYQFRAIAPEGVVVGVRSIDLDERGDLAFWTKAIELHFRKASGYALLETHEVQSADGTAGKELVFGHDEDGKPHLYRVRLFLAQDRLFLAEAGGARESMTQYRASVDWMLDGLRVRCDAWLTPILASHTCNRW